MANPINLRVDGSSTWLHDANTECITLSLESILNTTEALKSGYTGSSWVDFEVPAGKKFIALSISINQADRGSGGTQQIDMYNGAVSGTPGDQVWQYVSVNTPSSDEVYPAQTIPVYLDTFPAGHHVNVTWDSTDRHGMSITGVLTDA